MVVVVSGVDVRADVVVVAGVGLGEDVDVVGVVVVSVVVGGAGPPMRP